MAGMSNSADVIVVGAGPAGSTAAYRLAAQGASVLLLDRAAFPRDKPCGGGLTLRGVRQLPFSVDPVVEDVIHRLVLRLRFDSWTEVTSKEPVILMTQRRRLDAYLLEQAGEVGAEVRQGVRVRSATQDASGVEVVCEGGERIRGRFLVGADGATGVSRQALGAVVEHSFAVAMEGNVSYDDYDPTPYRGRALLEVGVIPGGYGWVFPKGDHANIGVGGYISQGPALRDELARLCRVHGVAPDRLRDIRGWRLPIRRADAVTARGRALLVGDAAGLVDPLSGDGMFEAFTSSRLASEAVMDALAGRAPSVDPYSEKLDAALIPHLAASWATKLAVEKNPRILMGMARLPVAGEIMRRRLGYPKSHDSSPAAVRVAGRLGAALRKALGPDAA
jgi:geranylgeranyl reductase family protein